MSRTVATKPCPPVSGGGLGAIVSWITTALSAWPRAREEDPSLRAIRTSGATHIDTDIWDRKADVPDRTVAPSSGPQVSCRMCARPGRRRVCAQCATVGFIELGCGCVERPDGTRYSCDAAVHLCEARPIGPAQTHNNAVYAAFVGWVDAANESANDTSSRGSFPKNHANWRERAWSQR